ncbi:hypothetical protein TVAG_410970 [Trichomonas vaginalis G3]|uniref:Uncharacterized protein n=1 Tax=Trichomonas vaginalis (strain ATCC PRA-98 / G3) TaxID=412133 RepID=A2DXK2_TRIV3|nr:Ankyrin repeat family [Trichomonas vaginalis G3]EAY14831.1 hypothetical protein TVAG_410970 [Trichomonas vaginalis G3]KAI5541188.1 Ankyrin repeat family [Trichomonas vaginalis G3]|eukprot:XP_001327054.1 hypothetical protein [Trichomonas vaginalis G3]
MNEFDQLVTIFNNPIKREIKKQIAPYVLKYYSLDDIKNEKNQTILHYFANNTIFKHTSLLISHFMSTNHADIDGNNPLHFASKNPEFFIKLVENGCNYLLKNKENITPLQLLVNSSSFENFQFIINKLSKEIKSNIYDLLRYCILSKKYKMIPFLFTQFETECNLLIQRTTYNNLFHLFTNVCILAPFLLSLFPEDLEKQIIDLKFINKSGLTDRINAKFAGIYMNSDNSTLQFLKTECPKLAELYLFLNSLHIRGVANSITNSDNKEYKDFLISNETIIHKAASLSVICLEKILDKKNCVYDENPPIFSCFQNEKMDDAIDVFIKVGADLNVRDLHGNDLLYYAIAAKSGKISYFIQNTDFNVYEDIKLAIELGNIDAIDEILNKIHLDSAKFQELIDLLKVKTVLEKFIEKNQNINKLDILKWAFERRNFFIVSYFLQLENSTELRTSNNDNIFHVIASSYDTYIKNQTIFDLIKDFIAEKTDGNNLLYEQNNDKKTAIDLFFKYYNTKFLNINFLLLKEYNYDNLQQFLKQYGVPDTKINGKYLIFYYVEKIESDTELLKCLKLFEEYNAKFTVSHDEKYPIDIVLERGFTKCCNFLFEHGSLSVSDKLKFDHPVYEYNEGKKSSNYTIYVEDNNYYFEPITYDNFRYWLKEDFSKISKNLICFMLRKGPDQDELIKCLSYIEYLSKKKKTNEKYFANSTVEYSNEFYQISSGRNMKKIMRFIKETESLRKYITPRIGYMKTEKAGLDIIKNIIEGKREQIGQKACYRLTQYRCIINCEISMIKVFSDNMKFCMDVTPLFDHWMKYQDCHFSTAELILKHIIEFKKDAVNIYVEVDNIFNKKSRLFSELFKLSIGDKKFDECSEKYNDFEMKSCHFVSHIINQKFISNYIILREIGISLPNMTKIELFFRNNKSILAIDDRAAYIGELIDENHVLFKRILMNGKYYVEFNSKTRPTGIRLISIDQGSKEIYFDGFSSLSSYDGFSSPNNSDGYSSSANFDFGYSLGVYYKTLERSILFKK